MLSLQVVNHVEVFHCCTEPELAEISETCSSRRPKGDPILRRHYDAQSAAEVSA